LIAKLQFFIEFRQLSIYNFSKLFVLPNQGAGQKYCYQQESG